MKEVFYIDKMGSVNEGDIVDITLISRGATETRKAVYAGTGEMGGKFIGRAGEGHIFEVQKDCVLSAEIDLGDAYWEFGHVRGISAGYDKLDKYLAERGL